MLQLSTFAWIHTLLSLVALVSGIVVTIELLRSGPRDAWTATFLVTAIATSVTGFGFHTESFGPSHWVGVISLVLLAIAVLGSYVFHLSGAWRWAYALSMIAAIYLLVFVAIVQAFRKIPALEKLAPTQSEPPFAIVQLVVLLVFIVFAVAAARAFRPTPGIEAAG